MWLSHSLVEFGRQTWSHFRKFQRTDLLCLWYFPQMIQVSDGALTSLSNVLQARGELHFRSPCKSSKRIYCALLPMVSPLFALVALYSNVFQSQDERPLQKLATLSSTELIPVFSSGFVLWCDCHTLLCRRWDLNPHFKETAAWRQRVCRSATPARCYYCMPKLG